MDDEALRDFLFDDLLAALDLDTDWTTPPRGDPPLLDVLEFERHCQFEVWTAVSNNGTEAMRWIVESDACVGLPEEAHALAAVNEANSRSPNPDVPEFHDILRKAYITALGDFTDFDDHTETRLPRIFDLVRSQPDWFDVPV
ncbi:MAG TPA: hypothetical protein PK216_04860 [Aquimonas sp.]|jgi:hypothetical protein|nr:hypothetical protein [Aquimonas sp.]